MVISREMYVISFNVISREMYDHVLLLLVLFQVLIVAKKKEGRGADVNAKYC